MKGSIIGGIISGLVVLLVGGFATWYFSDLRDSVEIGLRMNRLETDIGQVSARVDKVSDAINKIDILYARLDERVNSLLPYNQDKLKEISRAKNIPEVKVNAAINYMDKNPTASDISKYLQMNLGFTPEETKAVIRKPQNTWVIQHSNDIKN